MKIKIVLLNIFLFLFLVNIASAQGLKEAFNNARGTAHQASYATYGTDDLLISSINNIINIVLSLLGVIFVILTVYGGFLYMTARGNEEQTKKALSIITQSLIGLIIVLSAYAISYFVFKFFI